LLIGAPGPISIAVNMYKNLPYDPRKDLAPITLVVSTANVLVVNPSLGVSTVRELIAYAKARPGQLNYASGGVASAGHIAMELFNLMAGTKMVHIPYKGAGPALRDVLADRVPMIITNMPAAWPFAQQGKLKALAVTTTTRSFIAPNVPTMEEAGLPGYESDNWTGVLAPARTPQAIINRLNKEIVQGVNAPEVKKLMSKLGAAVVGSSPQQFAKLIDKEIVTYRKVVEETGAKAN
jgi:tripartite-type tricarboxylate transporter receptor subunit TctC